MSSRRDVCHCCTSTSTRSTAGTADHAGSRHTRRRSHPSVHNSTARRQTHPVRVAGVLPQACRRTGVTRRGSAVDLMERQHARAPRILGRLRPEGRRPRHQARARSVPPLVQVPLPLYCAVHTRGATLTAVRTLRTRTPPVHSYAASSSCSSRAAADSHASCSRAPSSSGARLVHEHRYLVGFANVVRPPIVCRKSVVGSTGLRTDRANEQRVAVVRAHPSTCVSMIPTSSCLRSPLATRCEGALI